MQVKHTTKCEQTAKVKLVSFYTFTKDYINYALLRKLVLPLSNMQMLPMFRYNNLKQIIAHSGSKEPKSKETFSLRHSVSVLS